MAKAKEKSSNSLKLKYVMKLKTIDATTISDFISDKKRRRKIRVGVVNNLMSNLKQGSHFDAPFTVNLKNGKSRIVNGNHRFMAIEQMIEKDKSFSINIWVAQYKDLSLEEERQIFEIWNIGVKQSGSDFLKIYWETIPYGDEMLRKLPCSVYGGSKISAKTIGCCHMAAKKQNAFCGGYRGTSRSIVKAFKTFDKTDINTMAYFMRFMEDVFGIYTKSNIFWKTTPVGAFYRIWFDNRDIEHNKMVKLFKTTFLSPKRIESWKIMGKNGGMESTAMFYNTAMMTFPIVPSFKSLNIKRFVAVKDTK
uniref:ParB/Sulfiredoxin domain-containing protein n=1 Tax=viral metagenome TaxID=1070528 RepID=A0A6C0ENZ0_9ZZZZ